jgi:hypothetical protein
MIIVTISSRHAGRIRNPSASAVPPVISESIAMRACTGAIGTPRLSSHSTKPCMFPVPTRPSFPIPWITKQIPIASLPSRIARLIQNGFVPRSAMPRLKPDSMRGLPKCRPVVAHAC